MYKPETSCMKPGKAVHMKDVWIKLLCNHKLRDFTVACENFSGLSRNGLHCCFWVNSRKHLKLTNWEDSSSNQRWLSGKSFIAQHKVNWKSFKRIRTDSRTVRLPDCPTARLPDCPSARLSHCPIIQLPDCPAARLSDCPIARLPDCPSAR